MECILECIGINKKRVSIDTRSIYAISEMEEDFVRSDDHHTTRIPVHVALFTDKNIFRVIDTYDVIMNNIKQINRNERLGL